MARILVKFRSIAFFISAITILIVVACFHENTLLVSIPLTTHVVGDKSSVPLAQWMHSCDLELYPNLQWSTVESQRSRSSVMTVFVPFAVENNYEMWDSASVDDSDFHQCPTSCVWIRRRDTSLQGLRERAHCAAQAHAVLFWLPLGHPARNLDSRDAINQSGLIRSENQFWLAVGTEPGILAPVRGKSFEVTNLSHRLTSISQGCSTSPLAMKSQVKCRTLFLSAIIIITRIRTVFRGTANPTMLFFCKIIVLGMVSFPMALDQANGTIVYKCQ